MAQRWRTTVLFLTSLLTFQVPCGLAFLVPINIINLDQDKERWDEVKRELLSNGIPTEQIQRIPAVYGKHLSKQELRSNATLLARLFCTPGMIGCYLSHRKFWEKTCREPEPWQIVLEDDVLLDDNFCDKVDLAIDELQQNEEFRDNWDVLLLGAFGPVHPQGKHGPSRANAIVAGGGRERRRVTEHCQVPRRPFGTHAYVITKRGAEKLLRNAWFAAGHADCVMWGVKELNLLSCDPVLARQDMNSASTIGVVPWGPETWLPDSIPVDNHSGVSLKWALNEPLIRIPGTKFVLTIGRGLLYAISGVFAGFSFRKQLPWLLPVHSTICASIILLLRLMSKAVGRPSVTLDELLASSLSKI